MIAPLLLAALITAPTPSPTLSPLPSAQVNYFAAKGSAASGLDVALVRSVIDNESAGDPRAVSSAGAVGLMQIEPSTASDCGISDRYDPLANAICGSKTLRYLITTYGITRGIAAYNYGPGNVSRVPQAAWPTETKHYVVSVIAEYDALQHDGALAIASPPPSPAPTPVPANPCAHRILCGPVRLVPRDPHERLAYYVDMGLALVDGLVTRNGLRGDIYPDLATRAIAYQAAAAYYGPSLFSRERGFVAGGARETDPLEAPFVHDGLGSIVAGGIVWATVQAAITHRWSSRARTTLDFAVAALHVGGITSWSRFSSARAQIKSEYATCSTIVSQVGTIGVLVGSSTPVLAVPDVPGYCAQFTGLQIYPH